MPPQTIRLFLLLEQFQEIVHVIGDQLRGEIADLVENLQAITLDILILVVQVLGNFLDALFVLRLGQFSGQFLIGHLIAPVLKVGDSVQDGHGYQPFSSRAVLDTAPHG